MRWIIHIVVLALLSVAEGSRLFEFYRILSGNPVAGIASAGVTVCIVFYLSFYGYVWASRWATLICVILSLASFVQPLREELHKAEQSRPVKELLSYPAYNPRMYWNGGKEFYLQSYKLDTERVKLENERILKENSIKTEGKEVSLYFWHLILGAVVLGVCVPVLNYLVSHKISRLAGQAVFTPIKPDPNKTSDKLSTVGVAFMRQMETPQPKLSHELDSAGDNESDNSESSDATSDNESDKMSTVAPVRQTHSDPALELCSRAGRDNVVAFPENAEDRRNNEIMKMFFAGERAPDIASHFGLSRQQIYKIIGSMRLANQN